ncbi:MAG: AtpZ/AtpI family protein [Gemmatimonadota bacterium]
MASKKPEPEDDPGRVWREQGRYVGFGLTWALSTLIFFLLGLWLDQRLGTVPWLSIGGAFFGGATGFYNLYLHVIVEPRKRREDQEDT